MPWRLSNPMALKTTSTRSTFFRHGVDVLFDRVLIERIYLRDFDNASIGSDLLGDRIDWFQHTTGKEDVGPLNGEGSGQQLRLPHRRLRRSQRSFL